MACLESGAILLPTNAAMLLHPEFFRPGQNSKKAGWSAALRPRAYFQAGNGPK